MRRRVLACAFALTLLSNPGCSEAPARAPDVAPAQDVARAADVALEPPAAVRVTFSSDGIPGPWWRDNATQPDFDRDLRMCRNRSNAARRDPGEGTDAHDAAYRAFLDCMDALAWTRGFPPPRLPANQPAS